MRRLLPGSWRLFFWLFGQGVVARQRKIPHRGILPVHKTQGVGHPAAKNQRQRQRTGVSVLYSRRLLSFRSPKWVISMFRVETWRLTAEAKASTENKYVSAAVNRCATQNQSPVTEARRDVTSSEGKRKRPVAEIRRFSEPPFSITNKRDGHHRHATSHARQW